MVGLFWCVHGLAFSGVPSDVLESPSPSAVQHIRRNNRCFFKFFSMHGDRRKPRSETVVCDGTVSPIWLDAFPSISGLIYFSWQSSRQSWGLDHQTRPTNCQNPVNFGLEEGVDRGCVNWLLQQKRVGSLGSYYQSESSHAWHGLQ